MLKLTMLSSDKSLGSYYYNCLVLVQSTCDPEDKLMDQDSIRDFNLLIGSYWIVIFMR